MALPSPSNSAKPLASSSTPSLSPSLLLMMMFSFNITIINVTLHPAGLGRGQGPHGTQQLQREQEDGRRREQWARGALLSCGRDGPLVKMKHEAMLALSSASSGTWSCHSWTQGAPRLPQSSCPFSPRPRPPACQRALRPGSAHGKLEPFVLVQLLPWRGCQDACTRGDVLIISPGEGLAACAVMLCEVTALAHKSQNNSVKAGIFIVTLFLPVLRAGKLSAVFGTLSAKSLKEMRPKGSLAMLKNAVGLAWARAAPGAVSSLEIL
uniref:Uncharacterized protein n=1 Tax=Myotis myotis TaxID=51298 RepID=A0A7J7UPA7_MYOMY|nr:hypothetical protein mMyoMyo1_008560 [Myotis myotis]